jgi:hypothetical protein
MSYLQIEIGGKKRGLKYNQLAIEVMAMHNDTETASAFMYALIYGGLRGNSYVKREEPDYTFEDVCDWIDNLKDKNEIILEATNKLTETQIFRDLVKKEEANDDTDKDKKKVSKNKRMKT